jgi:hypothetical protein
VIAAILALWTIYCRIQAKQPIGPVIDETIAKTLDAAHALEGQSPPTVTKIDQVASIVKNQPSQLDASAG